MSHACRLGSLVSDAVVEVNHTAPDRSILLDLPTHDVVGFWDTARLRRVIDNLLSNAIKYSPPDTPVEVAVRRVDHDGKHWATSG